MRTRYVDLVAGTGDSCRGDGGGRSIHAKAAAGGFFQVGITEATYIYYQNLTGNYGNEQFLRVSFATGWLCMGLFQEDLSVYNGLTVVAATLNIYQHAGGVNKDFTVYEVYKEWKEMEVTYNDRVTGVAWETAGCEGVTDRAAVACDVQVVGAIGWYAFDVSGPVAAWLAGSRVNHGVRVWPEDLSAAQNNFRSDEYTGDTSLRPRFDLTLT